MKLDRNLFLSEENLPASNEWTDRAPVWPLVRLSQGVAYWLTASAGRELKEGEVLVLGPSARGCLRASQLGPVKFHYFNFSPEALRGFCTLAERHYFETSAGQGESALRFLPQTHPAAQELASIAAASTGTNDFLQRCHLLKVAALVFAEEMARHQPPAVRSAAAQNRFKELINEMPEEELIKYTPEQLAKLCGCSLRHFSRLFRKQFGASIRAKQTELRLVKASQLLSNTDAKIIHVALESGYRHLGLFNFMFKKYLGMTPSEWRRKNLKKSRPQKLARLAILGATVLSTLFSAVPAEKPPPEKPAEPRTASPTNTPPAKPALTFKVDGYSITGNTLFGYGELDPIFSKYIGPAVTFDSIRQAISELQMAYRNRGFVTVAVSLPPQQLTNGLVKLQVTEGRLAEINILNNHHFSSNNIMRALPSLQTNILLNSLVFQRDLDRANANRDRQIYPVIGPGPDHGTTALNLKVKDRMPLHARLELNNYSTPGTPDLRINSALQYNNLWQLEHQAGVQYSFTPEEMKAESQLPNFYDQPLVANYSGFYRMPLDFDRDRDRGTPLRLTDFGYDEVTKRFRAPPAREFADIIFFASRSFSDTGANVVQETDTQPPDFATGGGLQVKDIVTAQTLTKNEGLGFRFSEPVPLVSGWHSSLSAGADYKSFRASTIQEEVSTFAFYKLISTNPIILQPEPITNPIPPKMTNFSDSVEYVPLSISWDISKPDKWGQTSFGTGLSFNFSELFDNKSAFQHAAHSSKASGNYVVLTPNLTREQNIYKGWGVRFHADGQWANEPLINNEQFGAGGQPGPRGYREGQEYGDTGWRVSLEPHTPLWNVALGENKSLPATVRLSAFTDYAQRYLLSAQPGRPESLAMWSAGLAISASRGEHFDVRLTLGLPLIDVPGLQAGTPRLSFAVSAQF